MSGESPNKLGRPKGSRNKFTKAVRDRIVTSLELAGGEYYLARQAELNPGPYVALLARALPLEHASGDPNVAAITRIIHEHRPVLTRLPAARDTARVDVLPAESAETDKGGLSLVPRNKLSDENDA
jgi:hypothetical protein